MASNTRQRPGLRKPRRKKSAFMRFYTALVIVSAVIVLLFCVYKHMTRLPDVPAEPTPPVPSAPADQDREEDPAPTPVARQRREGYYTFLLCATDHGNGGTDVIILASYDTVNQAVELVSVPRDTLLLNDSGKVRKINSTYNSGGIQGLKEQLELLTGIPIDYYVKVDLQGFVAAVDAIGGVPFDIPCNMDYDDDTPGQELHIHFTAGHTVLMGEDALKVMRFRKNNDLTGYTDAGRMQTQQAFIKAAVKEALQLSNVGKVGTLVNIVLEHVETNLTAAEITAFANQAVLKFKLENMNSRSLPGDYEARYPYPRGGWYVALDPQGTMDMVNQYLNPYDQEITLSQMTIYSLNEAHEVYRAS